MYCNKCGKKIDEKTQFCNYCGAPVQRASGAAANKRGSGGGKKITPWVILALVLIAVIVVVGLVLPVNVSIDHRGQELSSKDLVLKDFRIGIQSNRPILAAEYALNPGAQGKDAYISCELSSGLLQRSLNIDRLELEPGENTLALKVKTLFGTKICRLTLTGDIGYISIPDESAIVDLGDGEKLISNELILIFEESATNEQIKSLIKAYGGEVVGQIYILGEYHVRFSGSGKEYISELKERLLSEDIIDTVFLSLSHESEAFYYPNDTEYDSWDVNSPGGNNWALEAIDAPGAWDHINELSPIKIGVIDSSLQYDHPDLSVNPRHVGILPSNDFQTLEQLETYYKKYTPTHKCQDGKCVFCEQKDHGTHCTGIIGAAGNNNRGTAGVAWNAELYFTTWWFYTIPSEGQLAKGEYDNGMIYNITKLVQSGCRVISISVGSSEASQPDETEKDSVERFENAIKKLEEQGFDFLICKSAGNKNDNASNYALNRIMTGGECAAKHVVIVSSSGKHSIPLHRVAALLAGAKKIYSMAWYSNYGDLVYVAAPGSDIYSTVYGGRYDNMSGTSMATPMVAGVAGLIYGANPNLTYDMVKSILFFTGENTFCAKWSYVYPMVNAKNAVEWVLEQHTTLPELELPPLGFVTGLVQDAVSLEPIRDASVLITNEDTEEQYDAAVSYGQYEYPLPPGNYTMEFSAEGYLSEIVYHVTVIDDVTEYNALLNMVTEEDRVGKASGRIIDAFDAASLPYAKIAIYRGINNTSGSPALELTSDSSGRYTVELSPGNYTLKVSSPGYQDGTASILILPGETRTNQDCSLTPVLKDGEVRIVLTWGAYPEDLDSHLVGPAVNGSFHTFFDNMKYSFSNKVYDNLDVDDTTSYGPETTSIYVSLNGNYTYLVHDYTNRERGYSNAMAASGAQVKLYVSGQSEPFVFNVPNQDGTVWTVFNLRNGVVTPINTMSYESNPGDVGK